MRKRISYLYISLFLSGFFSPAPGSAAGPVAPEVLPNISLSRKLAEVLSPKNCARKIAISTLPTTLQTNRSLSNFVVHVPYAAPALYVTRVNSEDELELNFRLTRAEVEMEAAGHTEERISRFEFVSEYRLAVTWAIHVSNDDVYLTEFVDVRTGARYPFPSIDGWPKNRTLVGIRALTKDLYVVHWEDGDFKNRFSFVFLDPDSWTAHEVARGSSVGLRDYEVEGHFYHGGPKSLRAIEDGSGGAWMVYHKTSGGPEPKPFVLKVNRHTIESTKLNFSLGKMPLGFVEREPHYHARSTTASRLGLFNLQDSGIGFWTFERSIADQISQVRRVNGGYFAVRHASNGHEIFWLPIDNYQGKPVMMPGEAVFASQLTDDGFVGLSMDGADGEMQLVRARLK